jgi:hypothetical protein
LICRKFGAANGYQSGFETIAFGTYSQEIGFKSQDEVGQR